ncbi:MAG: DUF881 domain-containing protein [Armatimonadetes bacterium]|nr:DUF881 domain-containing protein [Armatimonadota bacterium]NIM24714.1 DUF881 domain-containing protein [Armatimonadota bacterium]NIM68594.1 DUF881 domain-containing protein [Armatimonadota bacterium]NIM77111.1 DUF881 domain-containing protein [Armatimonadota bacterium]NIN06788.1 DUF881 domain-containing protein [Armatimonadota bacterium]
MKKDEAHLDRARMHWILSLAGICLVMGALLAIQVRSRTPEERLLSTRFGVTGGGPLGALSQVLAATQEQVEDQAEEIAAQRELITQYEEHMAKEKDIVKPMAEQLANAKVALGLTAVKGPGIVLEVDDSILKLGEDLHQYAQTGLLIHDNDLLRIMNELWAAGAEAISLNDQRLVGGTAIRCSGPTTQVNSVPIAAPYKFIALGDPDTLAGALNIPGGVLENLRLVQFPIKLEKSTELVVPAVPTAKKFKYARPVETSASTETDSTSPHAVSDTRKRRAAGK